MIFSVLKKARCYFFVYWRDLKFYCAKISKMHCHALDDLSKNTACFVCEWNYSAYGDILDTTKGKETRKNEHNVRIFLHAETERRRNIMKKRITAMVMAGAMAVGCLAGCGASSSNAASNASGSAAASTSAKSGEGHKITVILKTLNSEYWKCVQAGIEQAEEDTGCEVDVQGPPSETSYDEQMNEIETVLASSDAEALVLAPLQPETAANLVADAQIPVLAVDTNFESDKVVSYIGLSNEDAAKAGGKYVAEKLGGSGNAVILAGVQGDNTSEDRIKGWTEGIEAGGCKVLDTQYTDAVADKAVTSVEGMMEQYSGEIDAIVCHSDDVAMGAVNAVEQAGRADEIMVVGFGGISGAEPVQEGKLAATVDIGPYEMGYNCVLRALDAINGENIDEFYPTDPQIIDSDNVEDFLTQLAEWTK